MTRQRATVSEKKQRRTVLTNDPFCSSLVRAQVDVMRRIAALVGAITLLTACSSGDIVVKTDLDESYVVKDSAVTEIELPIKSRIKRHEVIIETSRYIINSNISGSKRCTKETKFLSQAKCDEMYLEENPKYERRIAASEADIELLNEAASSEDPWVKQVKYRPIFIDLNDSKRAMDYVTLTCLNPNVKKEKALNIFNALGESPEDVDLSKAYYSAGLKVCQKYAYKDGGVFAYREAKKSDESKESD